SSLVRSSAADDCALIAASSPPRPSCLTLTDAFPYWARVTTHDVTFSPKDSATSPVMALNGGGSACDKPCALRSAGKPPRPSPVSVIVYFLSLRDNLTDAPSPTFTGTP